MNVFFAPIVVIVPATLLGLFVIWISGVVRYIPNTRVARSWPGSPKRWSAARSISSPK